MLFLLSRPATHTAYLPERVCNALEKEGNLAGNSPYRKRCFGGSKKLFWKDPTEHFNGEAEGLFLTFFFMAVFGIPILRKERDTEQDTTG